jgi:hypothetical protein
VASQSWRRRGEAFDVRRSRQGRTCVGDVIGVTIRSIRQ